MIFHNCSISFSRPIFYVCFQVFFWFLFFRANHGTIKKTLVLKGLQHSQFFEKYVFFMNTCLETYQNVASFSHRFFMKFHYFFGIDVRIVFFHRFFMKMAPKTVPKSIPGIIKNPYFSRPSLLSWFYVDFMLILVTILIHLAPFGTLLAPFGTLLAHFWCPLAHLWYPWGHVCSPWRSIFSFSVPPGLFFHIGM